MFIYTSYNVLFTIQDISVSSIRESESDTVVNILLYSHRNVTVYETLIFLVFSLEGGTYLSIVNVICAL